jgi:site-specific DNA recombinase
VKRFAIYARSATSQDPTSNFAIADQIHECKEHGIAHGYELVEDQIYQEVIGGNTDKTPPQLERVLQCAKEGQFDVLILRSYDRLSRRTDRMPVLIATLEGYGVKVESVNEEVPQSAVLGTMHGMFSALQAEVARIERERITARMKHGRQAKRQAQG